MLKRLERAVSAALLAWQGFFGRGVADESLEGELATRERVPVTEYDEWQRWHHHDDVTPEEWDDLQSGDPERVQKAEWALAQRQAEASLFFACRDRVKAALMEPILRHADPDRPQTPMGSRAGWDEDDEQDDTFYARDERGELVEIPMDKRNEWGFPI